MTCAASSGATVVVVSDPGMQPIQGGGHHAPFGLIIAAGDGVRRGYAFNGSIVLDVAPGRIFEGRVRTVGFGISTGAEGSAGSLETVTETKGWLRDPQRFPVVVSIESEEARGLLRAGGQATVVIYTEGHAILGALARLRIRFASWLSFVR